MKHDKFIKDLVEDLTPGKQWLPSWRSAVWLSFALLINATLMYSVQSYRPGFAGQLLDFPRLLIEILSAFVFSGFLIFWFFSVLVPGNKFRPLVLFLGIFSGLTFLVTLILSFQYKSPPASTLGARPYCVEEVFAYGLIGVLSFIYTLRKTHFKVSIQSLIPLGIGAGLIPATLMQISCMYSPLHSLLLHYGPILLLVLMALLLAFFRKPISER